MPTNAAGNEVRRSYQSIEINAPTQSWHTPGQLTSDCKTLAKKVLFASTKKQRLVARGFVVNYAIHAAIIVAQQTLPRAPHSITCSKAHCRAAPASPRYA